MPVFIDENQSSSACGVLLNDVMIPRFVTVGVPLRIVVTAMIFSKYIKNSKQSLDATRQLNTGIHGLKPAAQQLDAETNSFALGLDANNFSLGFELDWAAGGVEVDLDFNQIAHPLLSVGLDIQARRTDIQRDCVQSSVKLQWQADLFSCLGAVFVFHGESL
jgi:hypothetical protein